MPLRALRLSHAAHAFRNAFASSGFRRFGPRFARDYLRIAAGAAGRWGGTDAATLRLLGRDVRVSNRTSGVFLVHEIFVHGAYDFHPARPDPVILDCGANVGMASLYFRLNRNEDGRREREIVDKLKNENREQKIAFPELEAR